MEIPTNVEGWLSYTLRSNQIFDTSNLDTHYEAAVVSLKKHASLIVDDLLKESLFDSINLLIKQTRTFIQNCALEQTAFRLKLLDDFEVHLRNTLSFDRSTFKPLLIWNEENNLLYEIFMLLKCKTNKEGKPILSNSVEDIAFFLKTNFDVFSETQLSTIQGKLRSYSKIIATSQGRVKLDVK